MKTIVDRQHTEDKDSFLYYIQDIVKDESQILDIGSASGVNLFPFIDYKPKKLIGIEKNEKYEDHIFRQFLFNRNDYAFECMVNRKKSI